jgi:hypothetical protein
VEKSEFDLGGRRMAWHGMVVEGKGFEYIVGAR